MIQFPMVRTWILVVLLLYFQGMRPTTGSQNKTISRAAKIFQKNCPPSRCSADGPVVRYPLHLKNKPNVCSNGDLALSCSGDTTVVHLSSGAYNVTYIDYYYSRIHVTLQPRGTCLGPNNITMPNPSGTPFYYKNRFSHVWMNCSTMLKADKYYIIGPVSCLSGKDDFVYLVWNATGSDEVFKDCRKFGESSNIASPGDKAINPDLLEVYLGWSTSGIPGDCSICNPGHEECGLWLERNTTFCFETGHSSKKFIVIGITVGIVLAVIGVSVFFFIYLRHERVKKYRLKVEQFIKNYNATSPTRYTYGEIIKMTQRFKTKLGQGGFGAVFKGVLPIGIPVAVKILQNSAGNGEEFINEVSTIGRIHHFNVVRLLGFCSEGTRRALVYEFMENGSLDKYIFYKQLGQIRQRKLNLQVLQNMAISIAEGIAYLHQGCNQCIVHLDIKPYNILLDRNFSPKISDFGLSKICPKDQSYVTVSAARGTLTYMAPEMYSRNFGTVSCKSDVYSFGMLILEMVSGRRNADPLTGHQSDDFFPELIHEKLIQGEDLRMILDLQSNDVIARKLITVALWCIQWSPADRPTMMRVVNMLKGDVDSLPIPPKPSIS